MHKKDQKKRLCMSSLSSTHTAADETAAKSVGKLAGPSIQLYIMQKHGLFLLSALSGASTKNNEATAVMKWL